MSNSMRDIADQSETHAYIRRTQVVINTDIQYTQKKKAHTLSLVRANIHACQVERSIRGENRGVLVCNQV